VDRDSEKNMKKKIKVLTLCAMLLALCFSAEAQQSTKVPRIGFLSAASISAIAVRIEGFRHGLRELGYIEGKNVVVPPRKQLLRFPLS
jgi:putative tryptophan/tyrosine transport system substrate-binding protein